jgi:hypothetical protein
MELLKGFNNEKRLVKDVWKKDEERTFNLKNLEYTILVIWEMIGMNIEKSVLIKIKEYLHDAC